MVETDADDERQPDQGTDFEGCDVEPAMPANRVKHPDEIGNDWHPSPHFLAPLADEVDEWREDAERYGLDYREPTTLDRLSFILAGIVVDGPAFVPTAAAWWRARAWFDVHGPAGFRERVFARVLGAWDELESLEQRVEQSLADTDEDELRGFLVTVVEPFIADLRNWSRELMPVAGTGGGERRPASRGSTSEETPKKPRRGRPRKAETQVLADFAKPIIDQGLSWVDVRQAYVEQSPEKARALIGLQPGDALDESHRRRISDKLRFAYQETYNRPSQNEEM
jgi:hypothetical protein